MTSPSESGVTPALSAALDGLPARVRVHELARRAGLNSKETMAALAGSGVEVGSASSSVDRDVAEALLISLLGAPTEPAASATSAAERIPTASQPRRRRSSASAAAEAKSGEHPVGDPAADSTASADEAPAPSRSRRSRRVADVATTPDEAASTDGADVSAASATDGQDDAVDAPATPSNRNRRSGRGRARKPAASTDGATSEATAVPDEVDPSSQDESGQGPDEATADGDVTEGSTDGSDESAGGESRGRRRRRRGGRGRRGERPADAATADAATADAFADGTDSEEDSTAARADEAPADDTQSRSGGRGSRRRGPASADGEGSSDTVTGESDVSGDDHTESGEDADDADGESSSSRRRRRRRRRGGSGGSSDADNGGGSSDSATVQGVKGSTRLEAKRQRRRDSRDSRRRPQILSESEFLARRESVDRVMAVRQQGDLAQVALLEDGVLVEHFVSRSGSASMIGNVYLGRVQNVLPSMEAAFVDIGKGRNAVLYAGEVNWDIAGLEGKERRIETALSSGDTVLVQVSKDPIGHKGARLTTQISLPGRFLVYVPGGGATGISRKLPDNERKRLKSILDRIVPVDAGVIIRTAAEGVGEDELARDVARLQAQWAQIAAAAGLPVATPDEPEADAAGDAPVAVVGATTDAAGDGALGDAATADEAAGDGAAGDGAEGDGTSGDVTAAKTTGRRSRGSKKSSTAAAQATTTSHGKVVPKPATPSVPAQLYSEPDTLIKVIRDLFNSDINRLLIDGDEAWESVSQYILAVAPELADRVSRYVGSKDVFAAFRIDEQISKALQRKVRLPSGGSLVIDRTEAMTVIDVNTGKFTGSGGNLEETVTRNNLEAAEEIVRQLRLRDIGGIIVVDFIDMVLESNRDLVLRRLTECLGRDRTRHQVAEVTSLGLVQMTRKRMGLGLVEAFSEPCEHCNGRGIILHDSPDDGGGADEGADGHDRGHRGRRRGRGKEDDAKFEPLVVERVTADAKPDPRGPKPPALFRGDQPDAEASATDAQAEPTASEQSGADVPQPAVTEVPAEAESAPAKAPRRRRAAGRPAGAPAGAAAAVDMVVPSVAAAPITE